MEVRIGSYKDQATGYFSKIGNYLVNNNNYETPTFEDLEKCSEESSKNRMACDSNFAANSYYNENVAEYINIIIDGENFMKNNAIEKAKYEQVNNYYNSFITISLVIFVVFGVLALINPHFFPRSLSLTAILITIFGTTGLIIDKKGWKGKYKCQ